MGTMKWQPAWWNDGHASTWERVKEAMRRDWQQTKHDVGMKSGHELNQSLADTTRQMTGKEPMPSIERANPPKVIGDWNDVELPIEYGYSARSHYKAHSKWTDDLESTLKKEWSAGADKTGRAWEDVRDYVKYGFERKH
jgi:hypothetical protein